MALYLSVRGRAEEGCEAARDEAPAAPVPADPRRGLIPWSFADIAMASEHLYVWARIMAHLALPPDGSVLEYGPGSG